MKTLHSVKAGDRLIHVYRIGYCSRQDNESPVEVMRVTPKQIHTRLSYFDKATGKWRGGLFSRSYVRMPKPGELEMYDEVAKAKAEARDRMQAEKDAHEATPVHKLAERLEYISHEEWEELIGRSVVDVCVRGEKDTIDTLLMLSAIVKCVDKMRAEDIGREFRRMDDEAHQPGGAS